MANSKPVIGMGLAAASLASVLPNLAGGIAVLGLAAGTALNITSIALAAVAFGVSWKQKSYLIAGLLVAAGIIYMIPGWVALGDFSVIIVPGPILGVLFGLLILGLGAAKSIKTARTAIVAAAK